MEWIILFTQIMLINAVLSGDNAIVIALASRQLPEEQRKRAMWWGAAGAVGLRIILTVVVVLLLKLPFIQWFGSVLLLWIAVKLLEETEGHEEIPAASTVYKAISIIMTADFVMSLDNVLAIAAVAGDNYAVIIAGIALSIPLIVWGSQMLLNLMEKYKFLIWLGAALLGYTAGEMALNEKLVKDWTGGEHPWWFNIIPILFAGIVVLIGWMRNRVKIIK